MPGSAHLATLDRGIEGWYRALEVTERDAERLRVGSRFRTSHGQVKIVRLSRMAPLRGGVVVLVVPWDGAGGVSPRSPPT